MPLLLSCMSNVIFKHFSLAAGQLVVTTNKSLTCSIKTKSDRLNDEVGQAPTEKARSGGMAKNHAIIISSPNHNLTPLPINKNTSRQ